MSPTLSETEILTLCDEMEHSPTCTIWDGQHWCVRDDDGNCWTDATCTVPYKGFPECSCGYFAIRDRAKVKLLATIGQTPHREDS